MKTLEELLATPEGAQAFARESSQSLTAFDCKLIPFLYHIINVAPALRQFQVSESEFPKIVAYMNTQMQTDAFKATQYSPEEVIGAWKAKFGE